MNFIFAFQHLKKGETLPNERDIAAISNTSRQSIRECIIALEVCGCLVVSHGKPTKAKIDASKWLAKFNKTCKN